MSVGRERIIGTGHRAVHGNGEKVLEDRVTRTRVAEATKSETDQKCGDGTPLMDAADFVPRVRDIMVANGWNVGAAFQAIWANSPANQLVGKARDGRGTKGPLRIVDGSMEWVLTFERARPPFEELQQETVFASEKARAEINKIAERNFAAAPTATQVILGNFGAKGAARDNDFVNFRALDAYSYGGYSGGIDDLTAALARFAFFVIPGGFAAREGTLTRVTVEAIGIYFRDSFDFNDEQFLGWWRLPDEVSTLSPDLRPNESDLRCSTAWFGMSNAVYRRFRERTGRGADFVIYSDVTSIQLQTPLVYFY